MDTETILELLRQEEAQANIPASGCAVALSLPLSWGLHS